MDRFLNQEVNEEINRMAIEEVFETEPVVSMHGMHVDVKFSKKVAKYAAKIDLMKACTICLYPCSVETDIKGLNLCVECEPLYWEMRGWDANSF